MTPPDRTKYLSAVKFLVDDNQKLRQERDKLHEGIEQLIEDYERRIKSIDELLSEGRNPENGLSNTLKFSRLATKKSHFQTVKAELERLLKD